MEKIFEPGPQEQIEALKKELDLERECSQAGYLDNKKLIKRAQEAEGELTIIKGIGNTSPEMKALKEEIKNLKWIKDQDYIFLIDENKKLHKEVGELKKDNKKLAQEIDDRIARIREAGL